MRPTRAAARYPCGKCARTCSDNAISCDGCNEWFHYKCEKLMKGQFEEMGTSKLEYYCARCCLTSDRVFNFQASLSRLSAGANDRNGLKSAAMVESICLRNDPFMRADDTPDYSGLKLDSYALNVLKDCGGGNVGGRPLHVSGDGNCLFNSVSVLLSGTRVMATELRMRCCVELVLN